MTLSFSPPCVAPVVGAPCCVNYCYQQKPLRGNLTLHLFISLCISLHIFVSCFVIAQLENVVSVTGIPGLPGCAVPARPPVKVSALIANYRSYSHTVFTLSLLTTALSHRPWGGPFINFFTHILHSLNVVFENTMF